MNLVIIDPDELASDGIVSLDGRRAHHLRNVLGSGVGARIRLGVAGGRLGHGIITGDHGDRYTVAVTLDQPASDPMACELVLAVPRPKVLTRVIEAAASFAVRRITLTNAWRVDKSYLGSPRLAPAPLAHAVRLGAEQGATTWHSEVVVHRRLMELLDGRFASPPEHHANDLRLIAHPGGAPLAAVYRSGAATTIAIGPEGGWIAREVDSFVDRGFIAVALAPTILRVEVAVAAALGQLAGLGSVTT